MQTFGCTALSQCANAIADLENPGINDPSQCNFRGADWSTTRGKEDPKISVETHQPAVWGAVGLMVQCILRPRVVNCNGAGH